MHVETPADIEYARDLCHGTDSRTWHAAFVATLTGGSTACVGALGSLSRAPGQPCAWSGSRIHKILRRNLQRCLVRVLSRPAPAEQWRQQFWTFGKDCIVFLADSQNPRQWNATCGVLCFGHEALALFKPCTFLKAKHAYHLSRESLMVMLQQGPTSVACGPSQTELYIVEWLCGF